MAAEIERSARLLARREAALATQTAQGPAISYLRFAIGDAADAQLIVLVSGLAAHTQQMLADPRVALLVTAADHEQDDPQQRARLSLQATASAVAAAERPALAERYQAQLPMQRQLFALADFRLLRIQIHQARFIGGFAQARNLTADELAAACRFAAAQ